MFDNTIQIQDDDILLRRYIYVNPNYIREDGTLTSFVFQPQKGSDGLSVNIRRLTDYEKTILDKTRFRLCSIMAKIPRESNLECIHNPLEGNDSHALIIGKFTRSISKKLADSAQLIKYPN
jgi:hypothetical protein